MQPTSESTRLESSRQFREYRGSGKLKDAKVVITRGDSGIRRAVAVLMAREGADITIVYLPEEQVNAEDTKKLVEQEGRKCLLIALDLTDFTNCKVAIGKHTEKFGQINVLVNNASKQMMCKNLEEIDLLNVESTFRSNIHQMITMSKFAIPHMPKGSSIISTTAACV